MSARILVVDDTPQNVKLLADLLRVKGYEVGTASSGEQALAQISAEPPDLVLLDVMMPGLSGYDVCRRLRDDPRTALLPVVLVTALDAHQERVHGIEAGADDFLSKPINQPELFARVKSLLRIKCLQDERLARLKGFFTPVLAEAILAGDGERLLATHRREVTVVFLDLRGFTPFAERATPDEVMELLHAYHAAMGRLVLAHGGTLERFAGDAIMVFFNDPVPLEEPTREAVAMTLEMQRAFAPIRDAWQARGHVLALGAGIARGTATLGAIGFEGRWDYAAIGSVTNLAARLCAEAGGGEILVDQRVAAEVEGFADLQRTGPLTLKGFSQPVPAFRLRGWEDRA
jgi:class 3 adenylate cyclase